jgi:hypothetical protein
VGKPGEDIMEKSKREERKQRSEEHKLEQERLKRKKQLQSRMTLIIVVIGAVAAVSYFTLTRPKDGEERNGRIWSAAHGHWHDKYGAELR